MKAVQSAFIRNPALADPYIFITWDEVNKDALNMAAGLVAAGVERGIRIGLLSENRYEWAIVDLALLDLSGAINVSLYSTLPAGKGAYIYCKIHDYLSS